MTILNPRLWPTILAACLIVLLAALAYWVAVGYQRLDVCIYTGQEGGAYHTFAELYAKWLDGKGVDVKLNPSKGSADNVTQLKQFSENQSGCVPLAIVQGGIVSSSPDAPSTLRSLATLFTEPIWVFFRQTEAFRIDPPRDFVDLDGLLVRIGAEGSGTYALAKELLRVNGWTQCPPDFEGPADSPEAKAPFKCYVSPNREAAMDLMSGGPPSPGDQAEAKAKIDAMFLTMFPAFILPVPQNNGGTSHERTSPVQTLIRTALGDRDGLAVMDFARAKGYAANFNHLSVLSLPTGALDLAANLPAANINTLATTASLLTRKEFISNGDAAFLSAVFQEKNRQLSVTDPRVRLLAPTVTSADVQTHPGAERTLLYGPSWLDRNYQYPATNTIRRALIALPLFTLGTLLLILTPLLQRRVYLQDVYQAYKQLQQWDREILEIEEVAVADRHIERVQALDARLTFQSDVPSSYLSELYALRAHMGLVLQRLRDRRAELMRR